jgi:ABC-2 type transport system permease protein
MGSAALFLRLVKASLLGQARYPASASMLTLGQFLATGIEVIAIWALFHRFGDVQGWTLGEVAVFYGLANCMFAIADALGRGFDVLGTEFLRTGTFDRLLLRPRPLALQLMGHDVRVSRLGRLMQGVAVLAFGTVQAGVAWTRRRSPSRCSRWPAAWPCSLASWCCRARWRSGPWRAWRSPMC